MQFEHILVGVDFSESSRAAVRAASRACTPDTRLTLVYVMQATSPREDMDAWECEARALGATNVASIFLAGNPADEILELAHKDASIDLVVVGTHGCSGLAHVLIGSVAEKILRRSPCAVLAIPTNIARGRRRATRQPAAASIH